MLWTNATEAACVASCDNRRYAARTKDSMTRRITILLLALVAAFTLAVAPIAADSQRVTLAHMAFTLPDYISPVDVGTGREAEFRCQPPDECIVFADFYAAGTFFSYATDPSETYAQIFEQEMADRGIVTTSTGQFQTYYTSANLSGDRVRIFVSDGTTDLALDMYLTYGTDGGTRVLIYARPAEWTIHVNGNGQPVMERMLDSLTLAYGT